YLVAITIRATQKKMMSKPVTSTALGRKILSCSQFATTSPRSFFTGPFAGQPSVENGHSAELNQVSSTSSSWRSAPTGPVVPRRDAMAPPQLAADAPVLDVVEPLRVRGCPVFRHKLDFARTHRVQRWLGDRLAAAWTSIGQRVGSEVDEPLVGQHRFDHRVRAIAHRHLQLVRFGLDQEACSTQVCKDMFACLKAIQPLVLV